MRRRVARTGLLLHLMLAMCAACATSAIAEPVSGPHETIEHNFTTTQPDTPSGFSFTGTYHAAGDPSSPPPYMRKMVFYSPPGLRYDTSVPERCTASDLALSLRGPAACPPGSRLGGGTTDTSFLGRFPSTVALDLFNNANEQIILARSPMFATVSRGRIHPDGSVEFASPTCYPSVAPVGCPVDTVLQLKSVMTAPPYTTTSGGEVSSYLTTPPTCPETGSWESPVTLWWADGSVDTVVTRQPCTAPAG
jgi:hypothetical protein